MRLLLAEDDEILSDGITKALKQSGYVVDHVFSGIDADNALMTGSFDLLILDLGLPVLDGLDVLKRLRERKQKLPVLILTARDTLEDRVSGLDYGADDYLTKPFDLPELEARVRAMLRRGQSTTVELTYGPLCFDTVGRRLSTEGRNIELSAKELSLLEVLLLRVGSIVGKEQLIEHTYGWAEDVTPNAVEVTVHRLRRKLEPYGVNIRSLRGLGYFLEEEQ